MRKGFPVKNKTIGWYTRSLILLILFLGISAEGFAQPAPVASNSGPVCIGGNIILYETGAGAVSWLWSSDGAATFSSNTDQNPVAYGAVNGEVFTVEVTDSDGKTATATTTVLVADDPSITTEPVSTLSECVGGTTALSLTAAGGTPSLTYQWYSNTTNSTSGGTLLGGATGSSYIPTSLISGTTYYYCIVSASGDGCGSITSTVSTVNIVADPSITTEPVATITECIGGTTALSVSATGGTPSLTYQWYSNTTNSTSGGTLLGGATGSSYIPTSLISGTTYYYCIVSASGDGCGSITSTVSTVNIVADPSITTEPVATITECIGGTTASSVSATGGTPSLTYQWYSNTTNSTSGGTLLGGATGSSYIPTSLISGTTYYYCIVSASGDGCGSITSTVSTVNIVADPSITTEPVATITECIGGTTALSVSATGGTPSLTYQWYSNTTNSTSGGTLLGGATGSSYIPTSLISGTTYYYCIVSASGDGCGSITSTVSTVNIVADPSITTEPVATITECIGGTTALSVAAAGGTPSLTYQWYSNTTNSTSGGTLLGGATGSSYIPSSLISGTTYYYCIVSASGDGCGSITSTVSTINIVADPSITTEPVATITECIGGTTALSVSATGGTPSLTYQWYSNTTNSTSGGTLLGGATGSSYIPTSLISGTTYYYCIVSASGDGCGSITSTVSTINIVADPSITTEPVATITECIGGTTALSVAATGGTPSLTYQWYSNTTNSTSGGTLLGGATGSSYIPTSLISGTTYYYCIVSASGDGCGSITSTVSTVNIVADPSITTEPVATITECIGGTTALSVSSTGGTPSLTYQWYSNTVNSTAGSTLIDGATGTSYIPPSTAAGVLYYYCIVSASGDGCGSVISNISTVTVVADPSITTQPVSAITECVGGTTGLSISSTGGTPSLTYQWYSNTVNSTAGSTLIGGATGTSYIPPSTAAGILYYYCIVSASGDGCGSVTSNISTVTVVADPSITTQPVSAITECVGGTTGLSISSTGGTPSLTYQWYSNTVNSTTGSTLIGGATGTSYIPPSTAAGVLYYYCIVSASGDGCGSVTSNISTVTVVADPSITTQPVSAITECVGGTTGLSISSTGGTPSLTYQWYSNTVNSTAGSTLIGGATGTSYIPPSTAAGILYYYCIVSASGDGCGSVTSNISTVTVVADPSITTQPVSAITECVGGTTGLSISSTGGTPSLTYQWYSNTVNSTTGSTLIGGATGTSYIPPSTAAGVLYYYCIVSASGDGCGSVTSNISTVTVVADPSITTQPVSAITECVGGTTGLSISSTGGTPSLTYQWYSNTVNSTAGSTLIDGATGTSYIPPSTAAGILYYYCIVSASGDGCGSVTSNISTVTVVADPSITTQPVSAITECVGGTTGLSISSTGGTPSLTYQWYSNTVNSTTGSTLIGGATGTSYIPPSTSAGILYYYCIVSASGDGCGSVTSNISTVTIIADPSITVNPISPSAVCIGAALSALTITATGGTPSLTYQWYSNIVNSTTGGTAIVGATTTSYTPSASSAGTLYYYCTASASGDGCGMASSSTAAVTVVSDPTITVNPVSPAAVCVGTAFPSLSVTASGGTPVLLFQWYTNTTNSTIGGIAVTGATGSSYTPPSSVVGTLYYYCIVSASGGGCGIATSSTATATVNSIPTATISGTTQVCKGDTSPEITFTGASGIAPYTFTYTMNGSTRTISTSSGSNVATLLVPTSTATTYTYILVSVKDGSSSACSQSQSGMAVVTVNPLPTATISGTTTVCQEASSPVITFTGANGTAPYTFSYTINSVSQPFITTTSGNTVTVSVPTTNSGTFTFSLVSVTDASITSCTQSQSGSATVTVYALPADPTIAAITPPTCSLATGSAKLTGLPTSGTWILTRYPDLVTKSGTGSFVTISGLSAGTYNFKITNSNGCTSALSDDAVIPVQPITPTVVITNPAAVCSPSTVDLTASSITAGSTSGLIFTYWSDAAATISYPTPKAATTGTYYIKGTTSAGCFDIEPVVVTVIQTPTANAGSGGNECDLTFTFNAIPSVGTGMWTKTSGSGSVSFSNAGSPTSTVTVSSYGTYVFTWTEINGICSNSASVNVNFYQKPVVKVGAGGNNCGLVAYLDGSTTVGTGLWSMASGSGTPTYSPDANAPDASVTVSTYGTYSFKWTATNGTCSASATESIQFISMPSANAGTGGDECDLDHVMDASLGSGNSGLWKLVSGSGKAAFSSLTSPTATVTVDKFGSYVFSWTEVNATCSSTDHVTVDFHDLPVVSAGVDQTICIGNSAQLEAVGDGTFSWQPDSLLNDPVIYNPVATPKKTTTFTVQLIDQYGCINKDNIDIFVWSQPVANAGRDTTLDYILHTVLDASLEANETGRWSIVSGSGAFDDPADPLTNVTHLSLSQNVLRWTVTNNICPESSDDVNIFVKDLKFPTLITPNGDEKNEYLVLKGLETLEKTEIVVFDRRGTVVYKNSDYKNDWNGVNMSGDPLPDDTYFVVLKGKNGKSISSYLVIRR